MRRTSPCYQGDSLTCHKHFIKLSRSINCILWCAAWHISRLLFSTGDLSKTISTAHATCHTLQPDKKSIHDKIKVHCDISTSPFHPRVADLNVPCKADKLHTTDDHPCDIELHGLQAMPCRELEGVVVVMPTFSIGQQGDPPSCANTTELLVAVNKHRKL